MQHVEKHEYHESHVESSHQSRLTCRGTLVSILRRYTRCCCFDLKKLLKSNDDARLRTSANNPTPSSNNDANADGETLECAICLSAYQIGDTVSWSKLKEGCTHVFHYDCIVEWGTNGHSLCPVCRAPFWSNDHKDVIAMSQEDSPERMHFKALLSRLLDRRRHTVDHCLSNDTTVEVHIDGAAAQPNEPVESMCTIESAEKHGHRENIEQSQFCVVHGLIASVG